MTTPLLADFPELQHLTREDLEDLLTDPVYFQATFHSLSKVKELYRSQEELGSANESIAKNNLTLEQRLYDLRSETKEAFDEAKRLEARWKELGKEQRDLYQRYTPQFLLMRLKHSIIAQDDASEALASAFINYTQSTNTHTSTETRAGNSAGGMDVDDFVRGFKELRKVHHKRALWAEKWDKGDVMWRED